MKKKLIILGIIALILIGIIGGSSYAYFTISDENGNANVVTSGTMSLLLTDGQQITVNNLVPGQCLEKTFKVKNTGNVDTRYDVYLSEVVNTFVDKTDLVYEIISNDGGYNTTSQVQVPDEEAKIINQQLIAPTVEHTYTLKITFKNKQTNQNSNMGRTYTAKININQYNTNTTEKIIKLIDTNNNIIDKQIVGVSQTEYTLNLSNTNLTNTTNIYCNNGGIPTINGNRLNVSGITNDTECKISNNIVDTINNKLTTSKTGIVMTNNQDISTTMTIPSSKEVVLDLNGKKIEATNIGILYNNNLLEIKSSNPNGELKTSNSVISGSDDSSTTVENIRLISTHTGNASAICVKGNYVINSGTYIEGPFGLGCFEKVTSKVVVNDAEIVGTTYNGIQLNGVNVLSTSKLTINNSTVRGNNKALANYKENVYINDSTLIGINSMAIENTGTININGGNFESLSGYTINNTNNGTINIKNGDFSTTNSFVIKNESNINITGGSFLVKRGSSEGQIIFNTGNLNITDEDNKVYMAAFDSDNNWALFGITNQNNGIININGHQADVCNANYESNTMGLCLYVENGKGICGHNNGNRININGLKLVCDGDYAKYGVLNQNNIVNINNSSITSTKTVSIYSYQEGNDSSRINICNSNISGYPDFRIDQNSNYIYYKNNTTLAHNTITDANSTSHAVLDNSITCN